MDANSNPQSRTGGLCNLILLTQTEESHTAHSQLEKKMQIFRFLKII